MVGSSASKGVFVSLRVLITFFLVIVELSSEGVGVTLFFLSCIGLGLGFISGAVGIGGGIYLVPLIIMFGLGLGLLSKKFNPELTLIRVDLGSNSPPC